MGGIGIGLCEWDGIARQVGVYSPRYYKQRGLFNSRSPTGMARHAAR